MFPIPDCTLLTHLVLLALFTFRMAIRHLKKYCNIDYLATVGVKGGNNEDWLQPLLTLHIHRLFIFLFLSSSLLYFTSDEAVKAFVFVLPLLYLLIQRDRASRSFRKNLVGIVFGGSASSSTLSCIIFADTLTSFARPLVTIKHVLIDLLVPNASNIIDGAIVAFPFWIRLRQCIQETVNEPRKTKPLLNALKYATNFPVIILAYMSTKHPHYWKLATIINGLFNFTWDCMVDWEVLHSTDLVDALLVFFNVFTRLFWIFRAFNPALYSGNTVHCILLLSEVLRRMAWLVLRVKCVHRKTTTYIPLSK